MTWLDCDGKQLSIGDPVTLVGPIAGRTALGMHKHGEILGFGRIYLHVRIGDGAAFKSGERVSVAPDDVRYGHHGYPSVTDRLQVLVDDRAEAHLVEVLRLGQERGIVTGVQADQLLGIWQHKRVPAAPGKVL